MPAATGKATRSSSRRPNFTDKVPYRGSSEHLRIVERFTPLGPDTSGVGDHARRSAHVGAAVDVRDEPDARRVAAAVRVRLPRRQLRAAQHSSAARAEERMREIAIEQAKTPLDAVTFCAPANTASRAASLLLRRRTRRHRAGRASARHPAGSDGPSAARPATSTSPC